MIRIDITDPQVRTETRKGFTFSEQTGWAFLSGRDGKADPHPTKITIQIESEAKAFPKGSYTLSAASVYAAAYGKLALGRLQLVPVAARAAA